MSLVRLISAEVSRCFWEFIKVETKTPVKSGKKYFLYTNYEWNSKTTSFNYAISYVHMT